MTITYDGTNFYGMAPQKDQRTVANDLNNALTSLYDQKITVHPSGRTDRYVHAYKQYVNFYVKPKTSVTLEDVKYAFNSKYEDLKILDIWEEKDLKKQARFSAKSKTYLYKIYNGKEEMVFANNYIYRVSDPIDLNILKEESKKFVGKKNYASFTGGTEYEDYVREVTKIEVFQHNKEIHIEITGNGFLRYMVRNIVGCLVEVSTGHLSKDVIGDLFDKPERGRNHHKAPGKGLYLKEVYY